MGNNTTESKLDETIKNTLNDYEAKFDPGDWSRMESMLNAAPKTSNFSWSTPLTIIIGIAIIGGGYLVFKNVNSSKPSTEKNIENPAVSTSPAKVTSPPPAVTPSSVNEPPAATSSTKENTIANPPVTKTTETTSTNPATALTSKDKNAIKEKTEKDKNAANEAQPEKQHKVTVMGNTPIFGDMIDSSKGVIHETKEKETIKKAAKSKGNTPIGWDLLNQNIDSLKKHNEQLKKDSINK
ncbi:MAG: hypothetical protein ACXVP4_12635 [Bacteroidia bacterium]